MTSKTLVINSALGAVILALGAGTYLSVTAAGSTSQAASVRTVAVSKAGISSVATASGNVTSATTTVVNAQNCTGAIISVNAALGQQVTAGQQLLTIDPTNAQNALKTAEAQLASVSAQANQQEVSAAGQVTSANQNLVNAQQSASLDASQQAAAVAAAQKAVDTDTAAVTAAQAQPVPNPKPANWTDPVTAAQNQLAKDQQVLTQAQNQASTTQLKDKQQLATASTALGNAQNSAASAGGTNITSAQVAVETAQANLASCNVNAPAAGTVTAVNATVGALAGSAGSSGATGGGSAATGSATSGSSAGTAASGSSGGATAAAGLVTISDTTHLQVVAGFSEADVATMKPEQTAQFVFPALGQQANAAPVTGKVVSIAQTSSTTNGVVTYPVTVSIANPPASLRLGQSANITVTTAVADNALLVPSLAVTTSGDRQSVNVLRNGTTTPTRVTTGITANGRTQILTGLSEGDQIELPAISSTLDSGTGTTQQGNGFGGAGFGGGNRGGGTRSGGQ
ncbi:HlyD family efflux transporter periplasmic adaptor subunit [Arthrobacter sp. KBS0702]|uniref:efflux RND transporter periplasmic adaptor subunit n=1 Tax=Arthrobacter sp. KBS0702 TaxID=2578107 RepID=UPI00110EE79D|nr:HlyD family efflux transporter periplasmic adaptor subunit [Arthrobacter sp. KBS0702]QDW29537.1 HlyD family efflux transporter periplasmic adaptor subunit [Arthrobacter sp. KBS0702]